MLTSEEIIAGLRTISNDYSALAILWHLFFYVLIAALMLKWKPSYRTLEWILSMPLLSVAVVAWITGNPFNGTLFSLASVLVLYFGIKASDQKIRYSGIPFVTAGIILIIFGLTYPHFIQAESYIEYLYSSPAGLIPCPTLSVIIGFLLLIKRPGSGSVTLILILLGFFYGIFGVLKLAVYLDVFLILGTITLLIKYILHAGKPAVKYEKNQKSRPRY